MVLLRLFTFSSQLVDHLTCNRLISILRHAPFLCLCGFRLLLFVCRFLRVRHFLRPPPSWAWHRPVAACHSGVCVFVYAYL